ncbi:UNVERIFIED_CONTAM: MCM2/3/5 family protein [Hammondia hammondi]|eukprot:XP_008886411.1 MCM2/3/5 family protein [Hammondia hammondi]
MASYVTDDFDRPEPGAPGADTTEGGEEDMTMTMSGHPGMMGETLEFQTNSMRRGGAANKQGGLRTRVISTMSEGGLESAEGALVNYEEEVKLQRQLGEESNIERGRRMKDLSNAFKRDLESVPAVRQQLDLLQNRAAAIVSGLESSAQSKEQSGDDDGALAGSAETCNQRLQLSISLLVQMADAVSFYEHPLIRNPCFALPALETAVQEVWRERGALGPAPRVGILGWLGHDHVTPRGLNSGKVNRLVCVEGVVNRCTAVQPKLSRAVYVNEMQGGQALPGPEDSEESQERQVYVRAFYDVANLDKDIRDTQPPPERDPTGLRVNRQELGYSYFKNVQRFFVQEAPETAPTGQLPRYVEVLVEEDLCDKVKCGDRVRVWGVYRPRMGTTNGTSSGLVRPFLIANNIQVLTVAARASLIRNLPSDLENLRTFARRPDLLSVLTRSFAPSICGHELVKRGLLLQLAGGMERVSSVHRIRGDIHVLLVGDPSAGKSQLLRFVLNLIPGSVSATGRGSSGVGLTAAIVTDQETGERRVEGGAMVMADRSVVCIDEFDKMLAGDRVAIHEVMEQQTVTVAKAGIHTTLNARCSVLAAANPLYGCWADDMDYKQQLTFEDSLMSRFDLIFIVRDSSTTAEDERLATAVLRNVTEKAKPVSAAGEERRSLENCQVQPHRDMAQEQTEREEEEASTKIFCQRSEMAYLDKAGREHEVLTTDFLKKYIQYVRRCRFEKDEDSDETVELEKTTEVKGPQLSDDAAQAIIQFYSNIRDRCFSQGVGTGAKANGGGEFNGGAMLRPVTARTLEAVVRLATAHAKLKMQKWVTPDDVRVAKGMILYTLFGEEPDEEDSDAESEEEEGEDDEEFIAPRSLRRAAHSHAEGDEGEESLTDKTRSKRQRGGANRNGAADEADEGEEIASQMQSLDLSDGSKKKRRTRGQTGKNTAATGSVEKLAEVHDQAKRKDSIHQWIISALQRNEDGSGVEVSQLFTLVSEQAKAAGMKDFTEAEMRQELAELDSRDSAPLLFHGSRVYEC